MTAGAHFSLALSSQGSIYLWGLTPHADGGKAPLPRGGGGPDVNGGGEEAGDDRADAAAEGASDGQAEVTLPLGDSQLPGASRGGDAASAGRVAAVCVGGFHAVARAEDGKAYSFGENAAGQLCRPSEYDIDPDAAVGPRPPRRMAPRPELPPPASSGGCRHATPFSARRVIPYRHPRDALSCHPCF